MSGGLESMPGGSGQGNPVCGKQRARTRKVVGKGCFISMKHSPSCPKVDARTSLKELETPYVIHILVTAGSDSQPISSVRRISLTNHPGEYKGTHPESLPWRGASQGCSVQSPGRKDSHIASCDINSDNGTLHGWVSWWT